MSGVLLTTVKARGRARAPLTAPRRSVVALRRAPREQEADARQEGGAGRESGVDAEDIGDEAEHDRPDDVAGVGQASGRGSSPPRSSAAAPRRPRRPLARPRRRPARGSTPGTPRGTRRTTGPAGTGGATRWSGAWPARSRPSGRSGRPASPPGTRDRTRRGCPARGRSRSGRAQSRSRSWPRTGMTLNSAPVRVKALAKLTRLTRRNPIRPARTRSCARNGGRGGSAPPGVAVPERHRLGNPEPGDHAGERARDRVRHERGRQAEALGEQAPRKGAEADREEEAALVDGHRAPARGRRGDVGQHDLARREDEGRAHAGHEPGADEGGVVRRVGAEKIAGGGDRGRRARAPGAGRDDRESWPTGTATRNRARP